MSTEQLAGVILAALVEADGPWRAKYGASQISPTRLRHLATHAAEALHQNPENLA